MKKMMYMLLGLALSLNAVCGQTRYFDEIFSGVSTSEGVQYGSAISHTGQTVALFLDHFQPVGDTVTRRPVVIFVHGGAFISGSRTETKVREFCTRFAKRGYVTSSIDYRLGVANPFSRTDFIRAGYRAMQDAKAAVRYFRRQGVADSLRIDTTKIFLGGFSAGAFSALNVAYLDADELPPEIDTTLLGNIEGNSGNLGHSSRVLALMNCWGGVLDTLVIDPGGVPVISVHGTADPVVPYTSGISIFAGIYLYGSATITARLQSLGIASFLIPMPGVGHGFPSDSAQNAYWTDTTIVSTARFFYPFVAPTAVALLEDRSPQGFVLFQNYPNPFNPSTTIRYAIPAGAQGHTSLRVYDQLGREVATLVDEQQRAGYYEVVFQGDGLASGVYFYKLSVVPAARRDLVLKDGQSGSFLATKKVLLLK